MERLVRLLIVSPSLGEGGAERVASTLVTCLDPDVINCRLCIIRGPVEYDIPQHVPLCNLDKQRAWHVPRTILRLRRCIAAHDPDVILSMSAFSNAITGMALSGLRRRPRWLARSAINPAYDSFYERTALRRLYRHADGVIAGSQEQADAMSHCYRLASDLVTVLRNPVDFSSLTSPSSNCGESNSAWCGNSPVILAAGRLHRQKRYDVLLQAFARLRPHSDARLLICGRGPEQKRIESDILRLGIGSRVRLAGHVRDVHSLMAAADVFAMTSDTEGLPNALIEAQGLGLPAVATRCPHGPAEIIQEGVTGFLTLPGCPVQFAERLLQLLENRDLRSRMGKQAMDLTRQRFSVEAVTPAWENVLCGLMNAREFVHHG